MQSIHLGGVGKLDQQNLWTNRIQTWNINKILKILLFEEFCKHFQKQFYFSICLSPFVTVFLLHKVAFLTLYWYFMFEFYLLIKFAHTPHMNTFHCNFKKQFFKTEHVVLFSSFLYPVFTEKNTFCSTSIFCITIDYFILLLKPVSCYCIFEL